MPVTEALQSAQSFGPSIWFAVFIVLTLVVSSALYMRYVHLPSQATAVENAKRLTDVVEKLTEIVGRTDARTEATHAAVVDQGAVLHAVAMAKAYEVEAIAKVASKAKVDVGPELTSIAALMKFAALEYVTADVKS